MYYCVNCKTIHESDEEAAVIYQSGFVWISGQQLHAGVCKERCNDEDTAN